jgi:cytochrome c oxidase cbb3-type subunit 3
MLYCGAMKTLAVVVVFAAVAAGQEKADPPPDAALGKKLFESQCALCHGQTGAGGRGPSLNRPTLSKAPEDETLRKLIREGVQPEMPGAWQLSPREVASVALHVRAIGSVPPEPLPGDALRGAELYAKHGCAGCHMVAGRGEGFGPELSDIGARRNAEWFRKVLRKPSDALPEYFGYAAVTTSSGREVRGIKVNEDTFYIHVKEMGGKFHSFRKSEVKGWRKLKGETPMPPYEGRLSASEMEDVVAYLASLRGQS